MASPSSHAGYSDRRLTAPPFSRRPYLSPGFRTKPQLSSVFVIKRNHPGAKSRLPISLALSCRRRPRQNTAEISRLFSHVEIYRFRGAWDQLAAGHQRLFASSGTLSIILDKQYVNRFVTPPTATVFLRRVRKNTLEGKKESGPMNTQTRLSDRFSLSLGGGIKRECTSFLTEKMMIQPGV